MKIKYFVIPFFIIVGMLFYVNFSKDANTPFLITQNEDGIEITENGIPVIFYQKKMKSLNDEYPRNNYIHPLYNLKGEILTEDFPEDHPYHRGVYWAWHQIYVADSMVGDSWVLDNFKNTIIETTTDVKENSVFLNLTSD